MWSQPGRPAKSAKQLMVDQLQALLLPYWCCQVCKRRATGEEFAAEFSVEPLLVVGFDHEM